MYSSNQTLANLKPLSRNAIYAPLKDYHNETKKSSLKPVSSNLREKALYSFIEKISTEFHSPATSLGLQNGSTNGGRGLKARQIEQKLGQRALTLIKGGIGTAIVKSTDSMVDGEHRVNLNRKQKSGVIRIYGSQSNKCRKRSREKMQDAVLDGSGVLVGLNQLWNEYIKTLLSDSVNPQHTASLMTTAELIGAFIVVKKSLSCRSYIGKVGFIVDITTNTWKISVPKNDDSRDMEDVIKCNSFEVIILPKRNSTIAIDLTGSCKISEFSHVEISGDE